jgi:PKD repeat protein
VNEGQTSFSSLLSTQKIAKINYYKEGIVIDTSLMKSTEDTQLEYEIDLFLDPDEAIHIYGDFSILTELNGQLEIGYIPPRISLFELTYDIDQSLNLSAGIDLIDIYYEHEVDLASVYFQPIVALIAGVPVVLVPELEIAVGIETGVYCDVYTSISQEMDYTAGIRYEDYNWTTISEFNKSFNYTPPQLDCNAGAKAYIRPQFNILIYGVVSPYLYGDLFGKIESELQNNPWWNLYAGADLGVGVEAEILGKEIFDFNTNPPLISFEELIASASGSEPPTASFISNISSGTVPLTVSFTDQSSNNPTSWQWDFGDGGTSTQRNPTHTYNTEGTYTVSLTATNSYGSDTEEKTDYITVSSGGNTPIAEFTTNTTSGNAPLTVDFTDQSSNNPTTWQWDFGDSGTSTQKNPSHTYAQQGTYSVSLIVSNAYGNDVELKSNFISVSPGGSGEDFLLTNNTYSETDDLEQAVQNEYGSDYDVADWNDIDALTDITQWIDDMGLSEDESFMLKRNGAFIYSGNRQYFVRYSTDGVGSGWLIHDQIGDLYLGSWYGLNYKVLCVKINK